MPCRNEAGAGVVRCLKSPDLLFRRRCYHVKGENTSKHFRKTPDQRNHIGDMSCIECCF
jgi:hypothetical protein